MVFKTLPPTLYNAENTLPPNRIIFNIQPHAGVVLTLSGLPAGKDKVSETALRFCFHESANHNMPESYERLLLDVMNNDQTLFVGGEETELAWRAMGPVLDQGSLFSYARGAQPPALLFQDWIDFSTYATVCT